MGMFDTVFCKVPLPTNSEEGDNFDFTQHEWENREFQTKDLECVMFEYEIREDGLWRRHVEYDSRELTAEEQEEVSSIPWAVNWHLEEKSSEWKKEEEFSGYVSFYDYVRSDEGDEDLWVDFKAHFKDGNLVEPIELVEWKKEDNEDRKKMEEKVKSDMVERAKFLATWRYKLFFRFWNGAVFFVTKHLNTLFSWLSNSMYKIRAKLSV